jgi:membrane protein insertase Oxa1/YidC/SpoIIIJ
VAFCVTRWFGLPQLGHFWDLLWFFVPYLLACTYMAIFYSSFIYRREDCILLFVFMGVCQFLSMSLPQWLQKKRAEAEAAKHHRRPEEPSKQGQFMQYYMLVMICGIGIMWPAAMSLYWAINSVVNIIKTFVVQQIIDKKNAEKGTRR